MIRLASKDITIKPRVPIVFRIASVLALLFLFAMTVYIAYDYGLQQVILDNRKVQQTELELLLKIQKLERQNTSLAASLAVAERQIQVDKSAYDDLKNALEKSDREIAELNKEMNFYRSIFSPKSNQAGIQIQDLVIENTRNPNQYRYLLVMIQALQHQKKITGKVTMDIEGMIGGKHKSLSVNKIGSPLKSLNFKYFQNLEGLFTLPEGFIPMKVKVAVETKRKNAPTLERWYPWPAV